ncbi:probable transporter Seo1p [[Candida] anglica]|uniref:Probable transporter Seo1p n=1 Tax=[Candida] anglica TaxID=148631 RepID=A0ABP0EGB2_9ASCO
MSRVALLPSKRDSLLSYSLVKEVPQHYIDLSYDADLPHHQSKWFKLKHFLVDSLDKHPLERKFLTKLDFFLLSSAMLGYFIKSLNQSNISVAYINGMDEFYGMDKNQYNYLLSAWTVGYVLGQIPSNIILNSVSARYYLGGLQFLWGILSVLQVYVVDLQTLYFVRFIVGLAESAYFPGIQYILGSFYAPSELAKRSTLFSVSSSMAGVISPLIQQSVLSWGATHGGNLQPFQYMFVIDGLITFPIAFYSMMVLPNTPSTTNAFYLTGQDKLIALERRRRIGANNTKRQTSYTLNQISKYFQTWHIWVFPLVFLAYNNSTSCHGQPTFQTWMKLDLNLPSEKYNVIPSIVNFIGIFVALMVSLLGDYMGRGKLNHVLVSLMFITTSVGCALLAYWELPQWLHWTSYILISIPSHWAQPQIFSWVNRLLFQDDMKRNFVVVVTNTLAYVTAAWVPILVWDTRDKPRYFIGFTYTSILCATGFLLTCLCTRFERRDIEITYSEQDIQIKKTQGVQVTVKEVEEF